MKAQTERTVAMRYMLDTVESRFKTNLVGVNKNRSRTFYSSAPGSAALSMAVGKLGIES